MLIISNADASANILAAAAGGRLIRGSWHCRGDDGRELACVLGSIHPSVAGASDCSGALMPLWMAHVTMALFDRLPDSETYPIGERYGTLIARWDSLSADQWASIMRALLVRCIDDAVEAVRPVSAGKPHWDVVERACAECRRVIAERAPNGATAASAAARAADAAYAARAYAGCAAASTAAQAARAAAAAHAANAANAASAAACTAAHAAAYAASAAASTAAHAATEAAVEAASAAAYAAAYATDAAADAAYAAADAAYAAAYAASAAADAAARAAAAHRLFSFLLDQIEAAL